MSPQTGADLVGAGYPISRPLLALLGGNGNVVQPNVPIATNLDFALGGLKDAVLAGTGSVNVVAVPVSPGAVITKVSVLVGATASSVTSGVGVLFTGTGSAPGTTNAQPTLIGQTASTTSTMLASTLYSFTFATPVTISSVHAPYGYIYAGFQVAFNAGSPSVIKATCASIAQYPWYATSPVGLYMTSASAASYATLGTSTNQADPPVIFLS